MRGPEQHWTEEEKRNLESWGHKFPKPEPKPKAPVNPTTREEAARIWAHVVRWLGKGGRRENVIPQEFFDEVVTKGLDK